MPGKNLFPAKKASEPGTLLAFPESLKKSDAELTLSPAHERTMAIATGDLHIGVTKEVPRLLTTNKDNPLAVAKYGLEKLRMQGQITAAEFDAMAEICEALFGAQRGKIDIQTAFATVRAVYDALLVDEDSSPLALAIASVASGALASDLGRASAPGKLAASKSNGDIALVGGIAAGGVVGGAIGGVRGAIIGGVIGGIVSGVARACTRS
jgi:hypothetical protein